MTAMLHEKRILFSEPNKPYTYPAKYDIPTLDTPLATTARRASTSLHAPRSRSERHSASSRAMSRCRRRLGGSAADRDLALVDFQTLAPVYGQTIEFFDSVFGFMATLIGVIVLFTVGNTMSMAVLERTTEIGTLIREYADRSGTEVMIDDQGIDLQLL